MNEHEDKTAKNEDDEEFQHVHRWSLLKDREFYEMGDLIARYYNLATRAADCPHVDSPIVDTIETVAFTYLEHTPVVGHPMLRGLVMELMQAIGNCSFVAGMRFALDGHRLDSDKFMSGELMDQPDQHEWNDERASAMREWRENVRKTHYLPKEQAIPEELRAALEKFTGQKIPDGVRVMNAGDGNIALGIPLMRVSEENKGEDAPPGTGFYA